MTEIAQQLKGLRAEHHLTQQQLADALHVTRQTVSNWERGANLPDIETIVTIATTYHVSLDELILGKDGGSEMKEKLVRDGSDVRRAHMNMVTSLVGALVMAGGLLLWLIKANSVEYIDAEGFLHENFWLIPAGWFLIFAGLLVILVSNVLFWHRQRKARRGSAGAGED